MVMNMTWPGVRDILSRKRCSFFVTSFYKHPLDLFAELGKGGLRVNASGKQLLHRAMIVM
jgi:hypothetical protein